MVRLVNINLSVDPNSTVIEHKLHKAIFGENTYRHELAYESNGEASLLPDAPLPPPVRYEREDMQPIDIQVFINCIGLDKDQKPSSRKIYHEL
mmetsp:Transcript_22255/g.29807  ORF Transcript_22255/g.29807 Transcript_22255/m.29807 type:complete len:93 (+) Transcript_22255:529-807(+)|eukprot:CAMPEP_0170471588 /NCGR_PEP_ID=MMETSP0123-20130129/13768_1 /TAXON_ID=182087 /ORGANISM="Favella ehrenbergii, Strain Fehren 1" /LENGTH=92 /DNA_ID=CAMNT_0010739307 /DNA_START=426 /DNA_END=704 /DNA_ORIENTATION=+